MNEMQNFKDKMLFLQVMIILFTFWNSLSIYNVNLILWISKITPNDMVSKMLLAYS